MIKVHETAKQKVSTLMKEEGFDPSRDYENDLTKTLEKTNTDFLVLSFSSDWRFAPERSKEIVIWRIQRERHIC